MELVVVLIIALVFVGPKSCRSSVVSLGGGMREFKDSITGNEGEARLDPARTSGDSRSL